MTLLVDTGPAAGSFHGRAGRGAWFAATLLNGMFACTIAWLPGIGPIAALPWVAAMFAATSRRLHDIGRSGWWQLIPWALAVPIVISTSIQSGRTVSPVDLAHVVYEIFPTLALVFAPACLWLGLARGPQAPNAYGESAS